MLHSYKKRKRNEVKDRFLKKKSHSLLLTKSSNLFYPFRSSIPKLCSYKKRKRNEVKDRFLKKKSHSLLLTKSSDPFYPFRSIPKLHSYKKRKRNEVKDRFLKKIPLPFTYQIIRSILSIPKFNSKALFL